MAANDPKNAAIEATPHATDAAFCLMQMPTNAIANSSPPKKRQNELMRALLQTTATTTTTQARAPQARALLKDQERLSDAIPYAFVR